MRLGHVRGSSNVQDQRSRGPGRAMVGGGFTTLLVIGLIFLSGGNLGDVFRFVMQNQAQVRNNAPLNPEQQAVQDKQVEFVSKVLALTEDVWTTQFAQAGRRYQAADLVVFRGSTQTACGHGSAAMGPFYCPADEKVYIDLAFYEQLQRELGAPGDFAQAYVIAHEVGHHIQNQMGYTNLVHGARRSVSQEEYNQLSVRLELQADYLAGVWAHHAEAEFKILEQGDIEEGLNAAKQIGDDMLQKKSRGYVVPEQFTHGTSAQRVRWFKEGLKTGDASKETLDRFFSRDYTTL